MIDEQFIRSTGLIGEANFTKIIDKCICIIGLGGVGGTCFESLVRTGFNKFIIIDKDIVELSNLNRQILYVKNDVKKDKVLCAKNKALLINEKCSIKTLKIDINFSNIDMLKKYKIDFIIDCIDSVEGKLAIAKYADENSIPFLMSLGMANKIDQTKIKIDKLNKTTNDPLARKVRYEAKNIGIDTSKIMTVYSNEEPISNANTLSSLMCVTSSCGLLMSKYVISYFITQ